MSGSYLLNTDSADVDELVASMTNEMHYWFSLGDIYDNGNKCSLIYKVLQCIREACPDAYEPSVLSIGPYHHGAPSLLPMEREKWLCLDYILKLNRNRSLHHCLALIAGLERDARLCYSEDNQMDSRTFVQMLLLDSCFILVCLNGIGGTKVHDDMNKSYSQDHNALKEIVIRQNEGSTTYEKGKERMDESVGFQMEQDELDAHQQSNTIEPRYDHNAEKFDQDEQWYSSSAVYDLLLLENQIPFFVVAAVFQLLSGDEGTEHRVLMDNLSKFMEGILLHFPLAIDANRPNNFDHLLHLCYMYFKPSRKQRQKRLQFEKLKCYCYSILCQGYKYLGCNVDPRENEEDPLSNHAGIEDPHSLQQSIRWRSAVQYHEAGIEFLEREFHGDNAHSPLDMEFSNGILYIPCLPIDDKTATLFRNLIAFEQSCPRLGNDFAAYVYFMSQLVSESDDVALLARKGVIVHQLDSDEEVSALFSKLFEYVTFDFSSDHYLKSLVQTMEAHYQNRVNKWMAWLWHNHFGNPWLGFAALASDFMVFCSIGQTILAYVSYMTMRQS